MHSWDKREEGLCENDRGLQNTSDQISREDNTEAEKRTNHRHIHYLRLHALYNAIRIYHPDLLISPMVLGKAGS